jgi:hypothetical protein
MECRRHGRRRPAFISQHLQFGAGIGFHQPDKLVDPESPFQNAWCDECDKVLLREGKWNDFSEAFAKVMPICEGCLEEIRGRNHPVTSNAST